MSKDFIYSTVCSGKKLEGKGICYCAYMNIKKGMER